MFNKYQSFSTKILLVFFLASFIPTILIGLFSRSYVEDFIEHEIHSNLTKQAKSYGLLTFEKIKQFDSELDRVSSELLDDAELKSSSLFNKIEYFSIDDKNTSGFSTSDQPMFTHYFDSNNNLFFKIERLVKTSDGQINIVRGIFSGKKLFGDKSVNYFNEPTCIVSNNREILFCNESVEYPSITQLTDTDFDKKEITNILHNNKNYWLVSWELFLPTYFQSATWNFVIIKPESIVLASFKKFELFIIPVSALFFLIITLIVYKLCNRLLQPLSELTLATKKIGHGEYDINLDISSNDEFKNLGHSFNLMCSNLSYEYKKNNAYSKLERNVLTSFDIHEAIKSTLPTLFKLFDVDWMTITIKKPLDKNKFDTHYIERLDGVNTAYNKFTSNLCFDDIFVESSHIISHQRFEEYFKLINKTKNTNFVFLQEIECENNNVGYISLGINTHELNEVDTISLIELSERLSIIYTTYLQERTLYKKAHFDDLTQLPNRQYLLMQLDSIWKHYDKDKKSIALLFIDLDRFKSVNDLSGHNAGNEVLNLVAKRLHKCILDNDFVARLSSDEFCIMIEDEEIESRTSIVTKNIFNQFKEPFVVGEMSYFLGASIGIALGPAGCKKPQQLLENADLAMFKAKEQGKNQSVLFNSTIEQDRNTRLNLERHLHYALEANEISLNYQPKIDLASGKLMSAEALARWNQRELGLIRTDQFISLAEETGIINEIGEWILRRACFQYMDWISKDIHLNSIAVNVSAHQLASKKFVEIVESVLIETKIPPKCLDLEITESAFMNDEKFLISELNQLHELGVKISIDDFGKEYSSLNYLKKIPFDILKIDREFIMDLENDERDQHIVKVIINIGHTLGKKIVAEGIETIAQRNILQELLCDYGQGYLFSQPLKEIEFLEFATIHLGNSMETQFLQIPVR